MYHANHAYLVYHADVNVLGATRTRGLLLRRQPLYPPELREHKVDIAESIPKLELGLKFYRFFVPLPQNCLADDCLICDLPISHNLLWFRKLKFEK